MAVDRGTLMPAIAPLQLQAIGQERVPPGRIDHEAGAPVPRAAVFHRAAGRGAAAGDEIERGNPAALDHPGALGRRILQQDMVEIRAADLEGIIHALLPALAEFQQARLRVVGRDEFDAELRHADAFDSLAHAQLVEQGHVERQQGFADVKPWMLVLVDQHDALAAFRQQGRNGRSGGAPADDQNVANLFHRADARLYHVDTPDLA